MNLRTKIAVALSAATMVVSASANAQLAYYSGIDIASSSVLPGGNAATTRAAFIAATGGSTQLTFESALPAGVTITGGSPFTQVTSTAYCSADLCGGNTTAGGAFFHRIYGSYITFTFANSINYFGGYFGGIQPFGSKSISLSNGGSVDNSAGSTMDGGFGFYGVTDLNSSFNSITFEMAGDDISVDDITYGNTAATVTPEPSTYAMMLAGFVAVGVAARRRRKV